MPFMTGNVVSIKRLCKIVCNFELVFSSHLRQSKPEPVTGTFLVSTVTFHTVNCKGTHHIIFCKCLFNKMSFIISLKTEYVVRVLN